MTNYDSFTREEMDTLCEWVGEKTIKACFTRAPRELFRILHRDCMVKKLTTEQVCGIIYQNRADSFIAFILEPGLEQLFGILKNRTVQIEASGAESTEALVRALAESPFSENVPLYFKLQDDSFSDDYIRMTAAAVAITVKQKDLASTPESIIVHSNADDQQQIADLEQEVSNLRTLAEQYPHQIAELEQQIRELRSESEQTEAELESYYEKDRLLQQKRYVIDYGQSDYQFLSVCRVSNSYLSEGQLALQRLADVVDGVIIPFEDDRDRPHMFDNRDLLYKKDGPDEHNYYGCWNWSAIENRNDPSKDYVTTQFNPNCIPIEIVEAYNCSDIAELVSALTCIRRRVRATCTDFESHLAAV